MKNIFNSISNKIKLVFGLISFLAGVITIADYLSEHPKVTNNLKVEITEFYLRIMNERVPLETTEITIISLTDNYLPVPDIFQVSDTIRLKTFDKDNQIKLLYQDHYDQCI